MILFKTLYYLLRLFLLPLILIFALFNKKIRQRYFFEVEFNKSFIKKDNAQYDYAFEFSSEGELELIKPFIQNLIDQGKKIELIFCSDSVVAQVKKLKKQYPDQIAVLCLPIISFLPFGKSFVGNWISAPRLFLTRYDFFPELIFRGAYSKDSKLALLSGSLKKYTQNPGGLKRIYLSFVFNSFSKILMSTPLEQKNLLESFNLSKNVKAFEFRPVQILNRINKSSLMDSKLKAYLDYLKASDKESIVFGSFWADETSFLKGQDLKKYNLCFVPHKLDSQSIKEISDSLKKLFDKEVCILDDKSEFKEQDKESIIILAQKGILCELYSHFEFSYIAGGFRSSVHSLLEPYLSYSKVLCGPRIHKSNEYDLIVENNPDRIKIIDESNFGESLESLNENASSDLESIKSFYLENNDQIIRWLVK